MLFNLFLSKFTSFRVSCCLTLLSAYKEQYARRAIKTQDLSLIRKVIRRMKSIQRKILTKQIFETAANLGRYLLKLMAQDSLLLRNFAR